MEMLVGEQKQDRAALLLDPAGRRSLINPFRSGRKCGAAWMRKGRMRL
jgi:hypothetical protein